MKDGPDAADIQKLESQHILFVACGIAMKREHLEVADLVPGVEIVPAGIVEVCENRNRDGRTLRRGAERFQRKINLDVRVSA